MAEYCRQLSMRSRYVPSFWSCLTAHTSMLSSRCKQACRCKFSCSTRRILPVSGVRKQRPERTNQNRDGAQNIGVEEHVLRVRHRTL